MYEDELDEGRVSEYVCYNDSRRIWVKSQPSEWQWVYWQWPVAAGVYKKLHQKRFFNFSGWNNVSQHLSVHSNTVLLLHLSALASTLARNSIPKVSSRTFCKGVSLILSCSGFVVSLMSLTGEEDEETSCFWRPFQLTDWKSFPAVSELHEHGERGGEFLVFHALFYTQSPTHLFTADFSVDWLIELRFTFLLGTREVIWVMLFPASFVASSEKADFRDVRWEFHGEKVWNKMVCEDGS